MATVKSNDAISDIARLMTLSFELECISIHHNSFPKSEMPDEVIAQRGISVGVQGRGVVRLAVVCPGDTAECEDRTILFYETECELLQCVRDAFVTIGPDIVTGFDILKFGYTFMASKALRYDAFAQVTPLEAMQAWESAREVSQAYDDFVGNTKGDNPCLGREKEVCAAGAAHSFRLDGLRTS